MINFKPYSKIILGLIIVAIFGFGLAGGYLYFKHQGLNSLFQKDIYMEFTSEAYDTIKENYWEKITDEQLAELFKLATEKISNFPQVLDTQDSKGVQEMIFRAIKDLDKDKKKEFVTNVVNIVLVNLKPFGRSQLYTQQQETQLRETVSNIDKGVDLYESLGVDKTASQEQIAQAYEEKKVELLPEKDTSPEAAQELAMAERAFTALSKEQARQTYDQTGVEPTILTDITNPDIAYIKLTKLSPQSFEEFQKTANNIDKTENPTALILDLRGNIGGSIDLLQYFLGPFIGQNQLAYEFFHQEEYQPFKTQVGWLASLVRYKKVVVLIDGQTQSSAELMAAVLKKYNVGILVGVPTKGWGTVENTFPLKQTLDSSGKYSILLVHSLTLRDDNQPIEGKGVDPVININDQNWQQQLLGYFNYQALVDAVAKALKN
ncbi:S41 family peptidase [Candidatus Parcubacteria bacterium]|nr:DnaJ domain-containing protein [Patescibacteria group bacterium]MBU4466978.1 DnaJ domain-containing protein [Patescibacteria group bacterium]MCG2688071.1 S41 family peptidase [Candidatus Parcubacteria bacterium]